MMINGKQRLALGVGIAALAATIACPPHDATWGLFGGTRYVPVWERPGPDDGGVNGILLILQVAAIAEAVFTAVVLCRPGITKGQIGAASASLAATASVAVHFALDRSFLEPGLTLILLNLIGCVSAALSVVFERRRPPREGAMDRSSSLD